MQITLVGLFFVVLYLAYRRKYKHYVYLQKFDKTKGLKPRGKTLPYFPNGWYRLMNSNELKINDVKFIDYCGRKIVIFRGTNNKIYALDAYCSHMGANLGMGGVVKYDKCIQCPFHGWVFDGETGNCVMPGGTNFPKKYVEQYEYNDLNDCSKTVDGEYLTKSYEGNISLRKYDVTERLSDIYVWFDSKDRKPQYEPFDIDFNYNHRLVYRGESINYVNCHIQEIPENGADVKHFEYLHTGILDYVWFLKFDWNMKSHRAADENLREIQKHFHPMIQEYKMQLFDRYITDVNKHSINIISLDCHLKFFKLRYFLFNATAFQVGPSLVYLFLKSHLFEAVLSQSIVALKKFQIRVSHKIYTNSYLPYFVSAYMLYGEVKQLLNDISIWDFKKFGSKLSYNRKTEADRCLLGWRNWYTQFYDGCYEFQQNAENLEW